MYPRDARYTGKVPVFGIPFPLDLCSSEKRKNAMQSAAPLVATADGGQCYVHGKAIGSWCMCELHYVVAIK